jgi:hypothetical protein
MAPDVISAGGAVAEEDTYVIHPVQPGTFPVFQDV